MRAYTREAAADVVRNGWILDIFLVTYSVNTVRTVHGVLKARMLKRLAIPCSSGPVLSELSTMTGEGNGNPLQYSCPENPMDRGAWWATVHGVAMSQTGLKRLSRHALNLYLPRWHSGKESACQCRRLRFDPWASKDPLE